MSENRGVEIARGLSKQFLDHVIIHKYDAAYGMMDPISRRAATSDQFKHTINVLNGTFGKLKSYAPEGYEHGGFKFPGLDDVYPAIDFVYKGHFGEKSRAAKVTVTMALINKRAYVSYYNVESTLYDMLK